MEQIHRAWTADESLAQLSLQFDWDYVASMIAALRVYAFEYGSVPVWNFALCGGRPELAIPSSWAYTWPSVFAYTLAPNLAIVAMWIVLTAVGFFSARALFRQWTGSAWGASLGACVYAFSGYFAVRFHLGQVTFAFFHLVPALMLVFERSFALELEGTPRLATTLTGVSVAFLFFTAGLPHGLMHFYPVLLLLVAARVLSAARTDGWSRALRAVRTPAIAHGLGLWLAAYKVWPVIRWQLERPRPHVLPESYDAWSVIGNTLSFVPVYLGSEGVPTRPFPETGYNAFVGPGPWLMAAFAVLALAAGRRWRLAPPASAAARGCVGFGLAVLVCGLALSLGNENAWSPAYLFIHVPLLSGIRALYRYQILIVFGLSILVAGGWAWLDAARWTVRVRRASYALIALAVSGPLLAQAGALVWNVHAVADAEILARYAKLGRVERPATPEVFGARRVRGGWPQHQKVLVEQGFWVANCREDISLPARLTLPVGMRRSVVTPVPVAFDGPDRNSLTVTAAPSAVELVPHLQLLPSLRYNAEPKADRRGVLHFARAQLPGGRLTIEGHYPGPAAGLAASALGAAATAAFAWGQRRRSVR